MNKITFIKCMDKVINIEACEYEKEVRTSDLMYKFGTHPILDIVNANFNGIIELHVSMITKKTVKVILIGKLEGLKELIIQTSDGSELNLYNRVVKAEMLYGGIRDIHLEIGNYDNYSIHIREQSYWLDFDKKHEINTTNGDKVYDLRFIYKGDNYERQLKHLENHPLNDLIMDVDSLEFGPIIHHVQKSTLGIGPTVHCDNHIDIIHNINQKGK